MAILSCFQDFFYSLNIVYYVAVIFFLGNRTFQSFKSPFWSLNRPAVTLFCNKMLFWTALYRKPHNLQISYPVHFRTYPLFICGSNVQCFGRLRKRMLKEEALRRPAADSTYYYSLLMLSQKHWFRIEIEYSFQSQPTACSWANKRTSNGTPFLSSRTNNLASFGHFSMHTPQPMQASHFTAALPSTWLASNGQQSRQLPQALQRVPSTWATYPDEAITGIPYFNIASIPLQQHLQQLQSE